MEILDIVDEYGNPTGETVEREYAHRNGIRHRTSHVWLMRKRGNNYQLLLQKRSDDKDSYPGCFDISSAGHIRAGVGFEDSALRELHEELGIKVDKENLIPLGIRSGESKNIFHGQIFHNVQISKVFLLEWDQEEFDIQKEELSSTLWMNYNDIYENVKKDTFKHCIKIYELDLVKKYIDEKEK